MMLRPPPFEIYIEIYNNKKRIIICYPILFYCNLCTSQFGVAPPSQIPRCKSGPNQSRIIIYHQKYYCPLPRNCKDIRHWPQSLSTPSSTLIWFSMNTKNEISVAFHGSIITGKHCVAYYFQSMISAQRFTVDLKRFRVIIFSKILAWWTLAYISGTEDGSCGSKGEGSQKKRRNPAGYI